jgi:hypothetical protein
MNLWFDRKKLRYTGTDLRCTKVLHIAVSEQKVPSRKVVASVAKVARGIGHKTLEVGFPR